MAGAAGRGRVPAVPPAPGGPRRLAERILGQEGADLGLHRLPQFFAERRTEVRAEQRADPNVRRQAERLRERINEVRQARGLSSLAEHPLLLSLAQLKAEDIRGRGYWDHVSPAYGSPADMLRRLGVATPCVGENLACAPDPDLAHEMLMRSLEHRFNILYPHFTHIGIGVAPGTPHGTVYVQLFAHLGVEGRLPRAYDESSPS